MLYPGIMIKNPSDIAFHMLNVTEYCLRNNANERPDKIALIVVDAVGVQQSWSYHSLYEAVRGLTAGLKSLELPNGSLVTIQAASSFDTIGMLAIHKSEMGFMLGYLHETEEDAKRFRGDWFLTQDLVSCNREGYLNYFGRADNILKVSGGVRVSPMEIEQIIKKSPSVEDIACSTIWDPQSHSDLLVA